jgi:hypothetical protein
MGRRDDDYDYREFLIARIEGAAGTLHAKDPADPGLSVLSTEALEKLYTALWGRTPTSNSYERYRRGIDLCQSLRGL